MCNRPDHDGTCEACYCPDEWVVPADLREPQATTTPPKLGNGGEPLEDR